MRLTKAIEILKTGGIIAYPTDTTYGVGCDATNIDAIKKVYKAKGRDFKKPLGLAFSSIDMIKDYCQVSKNNESILNKLLPGPFMILLKKNDKISDMVTAGSKKVGVRIPDHKIVKELIEGLGKPIVTTSANISGEKDPTESSEISIDVNMIVEGECKYKKASTLIDIENKKILRSGPGDSKANEIFGIM